MTLLGLVIALVVLGFALWLVQQIPMDATVKKLITGIVIFVVVLWLVGEVLDVRGLNPRLW
jgi:hypothetical protein